MWKFNDRHFNYLLNLQTDPKLSMRDKLRCQLSQLCANRDTFECSDKEFETIKLQFMQQLSKCDRNAPNPLSDDVLSYSGAARKSLETKREWKSAFDSMTFEDIAKRFHLNNGKVVNDKTCDATIIDASNRIDINQLINRVRFETQIGNSKPKKEQIQTKISHYFANDRSNVSSSTASPLTDDIKVINDDKRTPQSSPISKRKSPKCAFSPPRMALSSVSTDTDLNNEITDIKTEKNDSTQTNNECNSKSNANTKDTVKKIEFRSGLQQLAADVIRKGGSLSTLQNQYGISKKSLGISRSNSTFVPPLVQKYNDNGNCSKKSNDNPLLQDERLKNIDPKMIDMIYNEIIDTKTMDWSEIAGLKFAKDKIAEIVIWPLLRPDIFKGIRAPPKGLLLFGPPGTGKTLIGKCIASHSNSTFFSISASSLTSKWIGDGEKMVRAMFTVARCLQPSVIFIDEVDSLLTQRSDTEHESSRRLKTEFLVQFDGVGTDQEERLLIVGATNRPQELDEAARRRFSSRLYIPLPTPEARIQIVMNCLKSERHSLKDEDIDTLAQHTEGYSGADMTHLCREAAMGPFRSSHMDIDIQNINANDIRPISFDDFKSAIPLVKASVSQSDLNIYVDWDRSYGINYTKM